MFFGSRFSYDQGLCNEPLIGCTLSRYFDAVCAQQPDAPAIVDCLAGIRYSYAQLKDRVDRLARGFMRLGIAPGGRLGLWSTNNAQWLVTQLAAAKIGAVLVNINPAYKGKELEYVLTQSGVELLVTIPAFRSSNYLEILRSLKPSLFDRAAGANGGGGEVGDEIGSEQPDRLPQLRHIIVIGASAKTGLQDFDDVVASGSLVPESELEDRCAALQFDDPLNIQYTSGTTGLPKGVTLSHHNLLNNGWLAARAMRLTPSSRFCVPMPFYHCGGMISASLATFTAGGAIVIPSPVFDETAVLNAVQSEKCTHLCGVPTMFISLLHHSQFDNFELSSLKGGFMAGAPCPVKLMREVAGKMHMLDVVILYGLTEASPLMTSTTVDDSLEVRATTVGRVIPGIELKIIDPSSGALLERGQQGELCCRGHGVMLGYWNNAQATAEAIDAAGWLHSGDLGVMSADGLINITGRKKDMIIRGGENIYPREIEEVFHEHAGVAQAQVFGVPDERLGEDVAVWMMLKQDYKGSSEEIIEWLKSRVAFFKVPRHVRVVDEFPMTVTGKIQKFAMREAMIKELGLTAASQIQTA